MDPTSLQASHLPNVTCKQKTMNAAQLNELTLWEYLANLQSLTDFEMFHADTHMKGNSQAFYSVRVIQMAPFSSS